MKKILSLIIMLALFAGLSDVHAQSNKRSKAKKSKSSSKRSAKSRQAPAKSRDYLGLLQGRWQSLDDAKTYFIVTGDQQVNYYGSDAIDTMTLNFHKEYPVKISAEEPKLKTGGYMTAAKKKNDFLVYTVEALNSSKLVMMYLPRGNLLKYKKVHL